MRQVTTTFREIKVFSMCMRNEICHYTERRRDSIYLYPKCICICASPWRALRSTFILKPYIMACPTFPILCDCLSWYVCASSEPWKHLACSLVLPTPWWCTSLGHFRTSMGSCYYPSYHQTANLDPGLPNNCCPSLDLPVQNSFESCHHPTNQIYVP